MTDSPTTFDELSATDRDREEREARARGDFVGFLACAREGRIIKVGMSNERQAISAECPHCGEQHETASAMPRPRRRGETCAVTLPDDPTARPAGSRKLAHIADDDFLAAIGSEDTPAQTVAQALGLTGTATGAAVRSRAEWLNYDARKECVAITRQGAPLPTLLRVVDTPDPDAAVRPATAALRGRQKISDAQVLAAIPADRDVRVAEAAVELGYASPDALSRRIRRRIKAAELAGDPVEFVVSGGTRGVPLTVRRAVTMEGD